MEPEILFEIDAGIGTITLNRPKTLNALTLTMITEMRRNFSAWLADDAVRAVVIKGAGNRAFCAGGDVRSIRQTIVDYDGDEAPDLVKTFFYEEYILNHQIHHSPKPYIALIDHVCMGGGVGLSVHGSYRVATERTVVGMPETTIGLFPDVGGGWFLSRLPGETGTWLALTGIPVKAADCLELGIATHMVASERLGDLEADLHRADLSGDVHAAVGTVLDRYRTDAGGVRVSSLRPEIDSAFAGDDVEAIVERLKASKSGFSKQALDTLVVKSPTSLKVTLEQIRRSGRAVDFGETMTMEYRLSQHFARGHDFPEGVRALLVDKDHKPDWRPARLEDVSDALVAGYFEPVPWGELAFD